ncbi:hypothetical protein [Brevibacillus dissolubilis]|nr:hypothetical protein [Brevibacillus dissolubilis]
MAYKCFHCEHDSESGHAITLYNTTGDEERFEVLCDNCYADWLLSLKG